MAKNAAPLKHSVRPHQTQVFSATYRQNGKQMSNSPRYFHVFRALLLCVAMLPFSEAHSYTVTEDFQFQARIYLVQLQPPRADTLPPPENKLCASYARNAVDDYATMRRFPECLIRDNPRWQADYRNHYQWCLTAAPDWTKNETKARDNHLVRCGVRKSY